MDSIPLGIRDFPAEIKKRLAETSFFLLIIGKRWLKIKDNTGKKRRLEDPEDHVRLEIEMAIESDTQIIPILVEGALLPKVSDLPESLKPITLCPILEIRKDPDFDLDMERLLSHIKENIN